MKIVIVEDEIRIREGLTKLIGKIDSSYQVIGEAENGLEGLDLILEDKPDVVITDIRMPDLDGLEMIRRLRDENIKVKIIILSAYSDFDYAKEAIKLGVSEYLLKPITVNDVSQALKNVEIQIREEKSENGNLEELKSLENIFYAILYGGLEVSEELCTFLQYHYKIASEKNFILIPIYLGMEFGNQYKKLMRQLNAAFQEKEYKDYAMLPLPLNNTLLLVLYLCENSNQMERWFQNRVVANLERQHSINVCFGWIEVVGLQEMKKSLFMLQKNLDWNIVLGNGVMVSYPKVTQIQTVPLSYPINIEKTMREALCALDCGKINMTIHEFMRYFKNGSVYSPREIKETYIRFLWSVINVVKEIDYEAFCRIEQQKLLEQVMSAVTYHELEHFMIDFSNHIMNMQDGDQNSQSLIIQRVKSMIHEFHNQGITLDEIADKLHRTPEYLGTQFHKEMGVTYSIYLRDYRVLKAKELLIGTRLKSCEVAQHVGYSDPKYFAKVFLNATGEHPAEYRKKYK